MTRFRIRTAVAGAAAALALGAGAPAALAHVELESSTPKAHATAKRSLTSVRLTFSGALRSGTVTVKGPTGAKVSTGAGGRDPRNVNRLMVALRSGLKAGRYTVSAAAVSADGHKETFSFWFRLK